MIAPFRIGAIAAAIRASSPVGPDPDPNFLNVSLLLHGNGANGSTTFTDTSPTTRTITAFGNARISTTQGKFGGASMFFDGAGDYITTPNSTAYYLDSSGTIEGWIYPTSTTGIKCLVSKRTFTTSSIEYQILINGGKLYLDVIPSGGILSLTGTTNIPLNTWSHFAVTRSANTWYLFLNGSLEASGTVTGSYITNTDSLVIGWPGTTSSTWYFEGYMDDLRITKGVARYVANFTPPVLPFPDY